MIFFEQISMRIGSRKVLLKIVNCRDQVIIYEKDNMLPRNEFYHSIELVESICNMSGFLEIYWSPNFWSP